jgi:phosphatidylserine/phosphatidylglycerophosphate/cardiolipin synthase-like enzyme
MKKPNVGIDNAVVSFVPDRKYKDTAELLVLRAKSRIYASVFILEILGDDEFDLSVANLLDRVKEAHDRGVYVRLLIGGSRSNYDIQDTTETALEYCTIRGIPTQLVSASADRTSHQKILVVDDHVLLGSHNWSPGAFGGQTQDSVLIEDSRLASYFAFQIGQQWLKMKNVTTHV